ncbi:MAG: M56 family metallopeptidase [Eubacteriales bacterium]|nr:M56 family metallopeptidase [Eubacteriales bacterium]
MEGFLLHILKLNIICAVIILLVKVMSVFLKGKFTAKWKYLAWLMLSLSLLIPVRIPEQYSTFHFQVEDAQENRLQAAAGTDQEASQSQPVNRTLADSNRSSTPGRNRFPVSLHLAAVVFLTLWITGAVIKMLCEALAYYISMKNLRRMSIPVYNPVTIRAYSSVCRLKNVRHPPKLMQNAGISTPLLTGLIKTELYLPAVGYTAEELKLIFHHELSHHQHKDLWYKMLLRICATVYWFNPFLLIMLKEAENDIENLCDTNVIRHCTANDHKLYRRLLLRTVAIQNHIPYITASLNDSTMVFKDRILYMIHLKNLKGSVLPAILLTGLLIITNASFVLSASVKEPDSSADSQSTESIVQSLDGGSEGQTTGVPQQAETSEKSETQNSSETVKMTATANEYEMYTLSDVNIRSLPALDGSVIKTIPPGSTVTVTGNSRDGWLPVKTDGISGYIHADYLTNSIEEADAAAKAGNSQADIDSNGTDAWSFDASETDTYTPAFSEQQDSLAENGLPDNDTSNGYQNNEYNDYDDDQEQNSQNGDEASDGTGSSSGVNDPFDLYSWDAGTNSYIPFQQAAGDGAPIGQGRGWYYYDSDSGSYLPW